MKYFAAIILSLVIAGSFFVIPLEAQNQNVNLNSVEYDLLEPIPQLTTDGRTATPVSYFSGAVKVLIGAAGVLAVLQIIIAGFKYLTTEAMGDKSDAKETIQNSLIGLLLAIGAYSILYTINPNLVNLNLNIGQEKLGNEIGNVDVDFEGEDDDTSPDENKSCAGCIEISELVPAKPAAQNGCARPGPCMVEGEFNQSLVRLATRMKSAGTPWQVTEMYPPSREHKNQCHYNGTCVDAVLRKSYTPADIKKFVSDAAAVGINAVFEVSTSAEKTRLINAGVPAANVQWPGNRPDGTPWITGNHFSLYKIQGFGGGGGFSGGGGGSSF